MIILGIILAMLGSSFAFLSGSAQQAEGFSIQFFGTGQGDIDRIKIPLIPQKPINIGGGDFTIEWWLKANPGDNVSSAHCGQNDGWIYGNILFDRDIWGEGDYGDFGIALNAGGIAFGVNNGTDGDTLCGSAVVDDGRWHHVAVTREADSGAWAIFVDGKLDIAGEGPAGDIRYREERSTSYEDDPYLVLGAEKHDAGSEYPSFRGWVDEVRVSDVIRYRQVFTPQTTPYQPDEAALLLLHFDEGPAGPCTGEVLDSTGKNTAFCQFGGSAEQGPLFSMDHPFLLPFASETPFQEAQPVTETPALESTATAQPSYTAAPVESEDLPTATASTLQEKTPTAALEKPAEAKAWREAFYLPAILLVLLAVIIIGLFWVRRKK
jgi:hypothetical protein